MVTQAAVRIVASAQIRSSDYLEAIRTIDGSIALLRRRNGLISDPARQYMIGATTYIAAGARYGVPRDMLLPSDVSDYESFDSLFGEMTDFSGKVGGIRPAEAEKAALFALSTWAADRCDPSPRAMLIGNDPWQSAAYLKVLSRLCRHSLVLGNLTPAYISRFPAGCIPTLLICQPQPSASLTNFIDATQHGVGLMMPRGLMISPRFSAVIIDGNRKIEPPSSFLRIDTTQVSRAARFDKAAERKAVELQNQLLSWRLDRLSSLGKKGRAVGDFAGSTCAWEYVITSCVPETQEWNQRVADVLASQEEARLLDPSVESRAVVVDALLILCHQGKAVVRIGEVAETANGILELGDAEYELTDRGVGEITTSLGVRDPNDKRGNKGYKITLTAPVKRRIHELGRSLNVPFFTQDIEPCKFCKLTSPAQEQ